jgi:hypothetical protein
MTALNADSWFSVASVASFVLASFTGVAIVLVAGRFSFVQGWMKPSHP